MKILLVNKFHYHKGGSETYYFALGEGLEAMGHEVAYFSMQDPRNEPCDQAEYFVENVDYNASGASALSKAKAAKSLVYNEQAKERFERLCCDFRPDVIHLNLTHRQISFSILDAPSAQGVPVVFTAHDYILVCPSYTMLDGSGRVCDACLDGNFSHCVERGCVKGSRAKSLLAAEEARFLTGRGYYDRIDRVIAPSQFMRQKLVEGGFDAERVVHLQNFVDAATLARAGEEPVAAPHRAFLYFGRLSEEKGVDVLIRAFSSVRGALGDCWRLLIAGDGPQREQLEALATGMQLGEGVEFLGAVPHEQVPDLVQRAAYTVVPARWRENMPYSIVESFAAGTPVIASGIGGIPELVRDGRTGYLCKPGRVTSLAEAMHRAATASDAVRSAMSKSCKRYVLEHCDEKRYLEQLVALYEQLVMERAEVPAPASQTSAPAIRLPELPLPSQERKLNGTVIVTYRCNARCTMCNRYKAPSRPEEEISLDTIRKLPRMYFTNITGGEPFIREDLPEIVGELYKKSDRIVISTNGFFTDRIIALAEQYPQVGIRISIEGLEETNNSIRGLQDGYNRGLTTLRKLVEMKHPDVGFGMTVQDRNAKDLVPLYHIANEMGMEFATASLHNSFYFVEAKNIIHDRPMVAQNFEDLVNELLESNEPKKWFRAYFNMGLINYIYGQPRLLPCDMAFDTFFVDPYGDVMPCNGTRDKEVMGNLNEQDWDELWNSEQAERVRDVVRHCDRNCWMIGSVSPAMHKYIWKPASWVVAHKLRPGKKFDMHELPIVRDYEEGRVTKEELDALSTCDMAAVVNDGLSEASRAEKHVFSTEEALARAEQALSEREARGE